MTETVAADDGTTVARRWEELKVIQDTLMKVWQAYMIWSVWFLTALYATLTFVVGFDKDNSKFNKTYTNVAAVVCVMLGLIAIYATVELLRYTQEAVARGEELCNSPGFHKGISPRTLMAAPLLPTICYGFILGYVVYLAQWGYFFCRPVKTMLLD